MTNNAHWYDLGAILDANRAEQRAYEREGIPGTGGMVTCPHDGSTLLENKRLGRWSCPMGDYETTSGPRGAREG